MPRKKGSNDMEFLKWKIKKLQRDLDRKRYREHKKRDRSRSRNSCGHHSRSRNRDYSRSPLRGIEASGIRRRHEDRFRSPSIEPRSKNIETNTSEQMDIDNLSEKAVVQTTTTETVTEMEVTEERMTAPLDTALLEILGVDPSATVHYGKDIHPKLASSLQHVATIGLTTEMRMELTNKYLIPANSRKIGAPSMNPEIKAAVTDAVMNRDEAIEARQKQLAAAISGLSNVLNNELNSDNNDRRQSKQLMDICRILCDIQYAESTIRRNFAIFSIKNELKEHLVNTKIDNTLFGEDLSETIKSAKAVTKSGTELKPRSPSKSKMSSSCSNLNWKNPTPICKQPQQGTPCGRETASPSVQGTLQPYTCNSSHASSSRTSSHSK